MSDEWSGPTQTNPHTMMMPIHQLMNHRLNEIIAEHFFGFQERDQHTTLPSLSVTAYHYAPPHKGWSFMQLANGLWLTPDFACEWGPMYHFEQWLRFEYPDSMIGFTRSWKYTELLVEETWRTARIYSGSLAWESTFSLLHANTRQRAVAAATLAQYEREQAEERGG